MISSWYLLLSAWSIAMLSTAGALFIGEVMMMTPCTLCWYQRIAMFPIALILGMASCNDNRQGAIYALPLAVLGAAMASYHTLLIAGWIPKSWVPCSAGASCTDQKLEILNSVQIPWLSLVAFLLITFLLCAYLKRTSK